MNIYRTHLVVKHKDSKIIEKTLLPTNAKLLLKPEPTTCFWEAEDSRSWTHFTGGRQPEDKYVDGTPQNELLIEAESEEKAEDILSIIQGGILLAFPEPSFATDFIFVNEYRKERDKFYLNNNDNLFKLIDHVGFGCHLASLVLTNKEVCYAIEKYKISLELHGLPPLAVDPMYGQYYDNYDIKHKFHTRAAFAIISAFSVIEELGLEIRSSANNPRFLNNEIGEWNPKVLKNLCERLKASNISESMTFDWVYRGSPTRIEEKIKPFFGFDSEWTVYGSEVRDKTLTFPEAIHNASYLRNFIASHKFNELTQYISPYDVHNIQLLARKIILLKLNLWQKLLWHNK